MKVFVVSLKRSVDRRERIQKQLDDAGIEFEFIDAIDASIPNFTHSERRNDPLTKKRFGYTLLDSEIACFASHYTAWEICKKLNQTILILEDNIDIIPELSIYLTSLQDNCKKYRFIKLFAYFPKAYKTIEKLNSNISIIRYLRRTCGTQGYCITPETAHKFISNANQFIEPVDDYMEKPYLHSVTAYCMSPDLVSRAKIASTIGSKRKDKTGVTLLDKCYIESFRLYEQIKDYMIKAPY
ncbi:glycosyltransferase family 25 protein [Aliivibrio sp. S4TY2]|uniref:glycosyltransferase family 25 protein n=1 Tax=unclassified Aliivibrio TaxID=2645654 RepID=UPI0023794799|nr:MULTISPECIES: glycosyltransferase family 25 protein [unclassified Aliivibrio]MDD9155994.1 glycosyltransferase family 25 protein [Aliivibrio sp. S4TY2]MDD9159703.1 glycosyltransferase family 25 protein [Aliivibrio sp. S4TY1]MDD9163703.1 glycosyltransferase family 25 protein [Aliivibrio sp. S4MY2]MDD9167703.1 glycosyltransferase family 25 protein [Aliivibrio sp. S4MY4]MDD9185633.1 glycosyltransferase family 25 protein [Aliivibrio sp. S4MY3]